jgi:hypothetical protein
MITTDNINTYTLTNATITTANSSDPNPKCKIMISNTVCNIPTKTKLKWSNIITTAGTCDVTFNRRSTMFYSRPVFSKYRTWGPAVDAINGFGGPDVEIHTGWNYIYAFRFNFTSGTAYFREK